MFWATVVGPHINVSSKGPILPSLHLQPLDVKIGPRREKQKYKKVVHLEGSIKQTKSL